MSLLCLPDEIIKNEIIIYLDVRAKSRLALSCKTLRTAVGIVKEYTFSINREIYRKDSINKEIHGKGSTNRDDVLYGENQEKRKRRLVKLKYKNEFWDMIVKIVNTPEHADISAELSWHNISQNPNITWDIIRNNLYFPLKHNSDLSANSNTNDNPLKSSTPEKPCKVVPWDWRCVNRNPNITPEIVEENLGIFKNFKSYDELCSVHKDGIYLYVNYLSENTNVSWEYIQKHPDYCWNWNWVSQNPNISLTTILKNLDYPAEHIKKLSKTYKNVPDTIWDWHDLSTKPDLTWDMVQQSLNFCVNNKKPKSSHYGWRWEWIARHPNITWDIIQSNLYISDSLESNLLCSGSLGSNPFEPNLSKYYQPQLRFGWEYISHNPNITWDIIQNNLDLPWEWRYISANSGITWDVIRNNLEFTVICGSSGIMKSPWDWRWISQNPNITWDIICSNQSIHQQVVDGKLVDDKQAVNPIHWRMTGFCSNPNISPNVLMELIDISRNINIRNIPDKKYPNISGFLHWSTVCRNTFDTNIPSYKFI